MTTLFGIVNCDTVKQARRWLDRHNIKYTFHDFRKDGLSEAQLVAWLRKINWETLLNRRGTTWRGLSNQVKGQLDQPTAVRLMMLHPTLIKRPVLAHNDKVHVGFSDATYKEIFRQL